MSKIVENLSNKVIGIGDITILPGEQATVPSAYANNPVVSIYEVSGLIKAVNTDDGNGESEIADEGNADQAGEAQDKEITAEALRKARLASLEGITEEDLGALAKELGISPADCKDNADVLKKVKAALKK